MYKSIAFFVLFLSLLAGENLYAQDLKTSVNDNKLLDSLRKKEEEGSDSVVFTSKFIRYATLRLTKDSIQTLPLDTSLTGFHNFSVLAQPRTPTIGLGNLGLPAMPLLFEPVKTIGFDAGFHTLDFYKMTQDDVRYYQARAPFTSLYYVNAGEKEQVFRVIHTQNIKRNWNFGANFNRIGANGEYRRQRGDHLNGALFTWYQSPGKRYNLWASGVFNTLKAQENGSIVKDSIFLPGALDIARESEIVRLTNSRRLYRQNSIMLKQTYFVGRIDSVAQEITDKILPTNKISYTFKYNTNSFAFLKDETDNQEVIPPGKASLSFTNDSTSYKQIQNEFIYTFFLRSRGALKNELKIDAGIRHDFYNYSQQVLYKDQSPYYNYKSSFQNVSLLGFAGYRFSNRIDLNVDLQQIVQGRQIGDFLYEAKSNVLLSRSVGRVVLGAYFQNKSPEEVYERFFSNHLDWVNKFDRTKTVNFSFNYLNDKLKVDIGAQYFLIDNHHYFAAGGEEDPLLITPQQATAPINLFKVTLGKRFSYGKFRLDSYVVYQKTDNQNILRTPEVYTFNSFYIDQTLFKVLRANIGFDVRYNTPYKAYRYSVAAGQFYIGSEETFTAIPIVDVWFKASLRKANIFVKCDYINQGYPLNGYYTVDRYPMQDRALFKFGVSWNFYD